MLFPCPGEGCFKAYSHFTYLQAHLDTGRHKMVLEQETLYDNAMKLYAFKLTEGHMRIPSLESNIQTGDGSYPPKKGLENHQKEGAVFGQAKTISNRTVLERRGKWTEM